jgi:hypothetical protein
MHVLSDHLSSHQKLLDFGGIPPRLHVSGTLNQSHTTIAALLNAQHFTAVANILFLLVNTREEHGNPQVLQLPLLGIQVEYVTKVQKVFISCWRIHPSHADKQSSIISHDSMIETWSLELGELERKVLAHQTK